MHHLKPSDSPGHVRARAERVAPGDAGLINAGQSRLYRVLASSPGRVFTTAELAGTLKLTRRAVDALALSLRDAIAHATGATMLESVWGVGYRLTAPGVRRSAAEPCGGSVADGQALRWADRRERREPAGQVEGEAALDPRTAPGTPQADENPRPEQRAG